MTTAPPPATPHPDTPPPAWWRDPWLWLAMLLVGGALVWQSTLKYTSFRSTMLDFGNMAQAIASVTRGEPLLFTQAFGEMSRMRGHAEAIYYALAVPYALLPDPRLLLVVQATLFTLGAIPVYRLAMRHIAVRWQALALVLIYLLYPVAQTAVLADLHGDPFAAAFLLFALDALDEHRWLRYGLFLALALLSKVYTAVAVAVLGGVLVLWGSGITRRVGFITGAAAVLYGAVVFFAIRPLFPGNPVAGATQTYLQFYFEQTEANIRDGTILAVALNFGIALLPAAFLLLGGGSYWFTPGAVLLAGIVMSSGPGVGYYAYHHYAMVVPFILRAMIANQAFLQHKHGILTTLPLIVSLMLTVGVGYRFVHMPLYPPYYAALPERLPTARDDLKRAWLAAEVPPAAPLLASTNYAAQLTNRAVLHNPAHFAFENPAAIDERVSYVLLDVLNEDAVRMGNLARDLLALQQFARDPAFAVVAARDGLVLLARQPTPRPALAQTIAALPAPPGGTPVATFGDSLTLWTADVQPVPDTANRYEATLVWQHTGDAPLPPLVAVSHFDGVPFSRVPHLPTFALQPTDTWQPGDVYRETFVFAVPPGTPPGSYPWRVGWYHPYVTGTAPDGTLLEEPLDEPLLPYTDERSRLLGSDVVPLGTLTVGGAGGAGDDGNPADE